METIRIHCTNDGRYHDVQPGMTLAELSARICTSLPDTDAGRDNCSAEHPTVPVLAALVDNQLKELGFRIMMPHEIEFIGYNHPDGRRTYIRSLCFVLQKAIRDLFPDHTLVIDYSLPSGLYCEIRERDKTSGGSAEPQAKTEDGRPVIHPTETADLMAIRASMQEIISRDIPLTKRKLTSEEAIRIFEENFSATPAVRPSLANRFRTPGTGRSPLLGTGMTQLWPTHSTGRSFRPQDILPASPYPGSRTVSASSIRWKAAHRR